MTAANSKQTRDHGGNLDAAVQRHGGAPADWIDLSTGINPVPFDIPPIPPRAWAALPRASDMARLVTAARRAYAARAKVVPMAGAQAAIQVCPRLAPPGNARVLGPTYNEHAAALRAAGWQVAEVGAPGDLEGADLAVVVNPNNPDGRRTAPEALLSLAGSVGLLVIDESFADAEPGLSLVPHLSPDGGTDGGPGAKNVIVLRSFGKFFGLAGLRLGFAVTADALAAKLAEFAGPWPVSGPAIEIACQALTDRGWHRATMARLSRDAEHLDALAQAAGWRLVGGTPLFRTYDTGDARAAQERLARHRIWSRVFPYSTTWIRLGLAGAEADWARLETALADPR